MEPFPRLRVEERAIVYACEGGDLIRLGMERLKPRDEVASFEVSLASVGRGNVQQRLVSEILYQVEACDRVVKRAFRHRKTRLLQKCSYGLKRRFQKPLRWLGLGVSNHLSVRRISFESCDQPTRRTSLKLDSIKAACAESGRDIFDGAGRAGEVFLANLSKTQGIDFADLYLFLNVVCFLFHH